jgi:hypothetical protein
MSRGDAYGDEVHSLRHISDEDAGRLLSGDLQAADPSLDELAAFVRDVGVAYSEPPTEPVQARHLDAMRRAARPNAAGWNPFAEPGSAPGRDGPGLPERVRRGLAALIPRPAAVAAALAVCLAVSGLTALGALPDRVQAAVADAARAVGVRVPDPDAKPRPVHHEPRSEPPAPRALRPAGPGPVQLSHPRRAAASVPAHERADRAPQDDGCATQDCNDDGWENAGPTQVPDVPTQTQPLQPPDQPPAGVPVDPAPAVTPQPGANDSQEGEPAP